MAADLDPLFLKAIALLNSRHTDSGRQLSALIQDYRDKLRGEPRREKTESKSSRDAIPDRKSPKLVEKPSQVKERAVSPVFTAAFSSSAAPKSVDTITKTSALELVETVEELSSGSFQEHSRDEQLDAGMVESLTDLNSSFGETVIEELSSSSLLEPRKKKSRILIESEESASSASEEEEVPESLLEEPINLDPDGPLCCLCQSHKTDSADNCLVECHECHNYYHQRCHKPPMTNKDVHDPRFVLYCSQCSRRMRKEMQAAQQSTSSSSSSTPQETTTTTKPVANPFQLPKASFQQPFRRPPSSTGNPDNSKNTPISGTLTTPLPGNGNNGQSQNSQRGSAFLPQDVRMKSMKRLEQVKKRAKMQQQMRKRDLQFYQHRQVVTIRDEEPKLSSDDVQWIRTVVHKSQR